MSRLFIGFAFSQPFRDEILNWQRNYLAWPVNWLEPANWHLTVVAPWEDDNLEEAKEIFAELKGRFKPLPVSFNRVCFGPNAFSPRLIWATGQIDPAVEDIKKAALSALGLDEDRRPFIAHVTLARFRPETFPTLPARELNEAVSWETVLNTLVLFESHLGPAGAEYERLAEIEL